MFNGETLWEKILEKIKEKIPEQTFKTWFSPTKGLQYENKTLVVEVPNLFFIDWLEEHYLPLINETAHEVSREYIGISFKPSNVESIKTEPPLKEVVSFPSPKTNLRERYTFENFVVGKCNQFAQAAALAVAKAPAKTYNPLFIYGGVGLGKTHLMHAVGNYALSLYKNSRIFYIPAEKFMNEMIYAIKNREILEFKKKYRSLDMLLIDDIHFLGDKESLQEEIFHTFNALYGAQKQIIVTSDRPPREIPSLEERLISRFQWGLVVDIQPPDLETRIAILKKKSELDGITIPEDVIFYIANNIRTNIRELEGSLVRLLALSSLTNTEINLSTAKEMLNSIIGDKKKEVKIQHIFKVVADFFDVSEESLTGKRRTASVALPRQVGMYILRELTPLSLKEIGAKFGGRDHTTVLHAYDKISKMIRENKEFSNKIDKIIRKLTM
ncbi:MAG: chromosomal replication initiation protein DnaA [Candidatus Cloacimonas sp. 4484_209]|nr:MAG: chromosomal replication initiation protein DnaA [Candidatus Cloacimonas sp. 4484_209]